MRVKERKSVVDYILLSSRRLVMDRMMVEDSGELNLEFDHSLMWCDPRLKWKVED